MRDYGIGPDYSVRLYKIAPETRRFHRLILRRKTRLLLIFHGCPTGFSWERSINMPSRLSITAEDPITFLSSRRYVTDSEEAAS